MGIFKLLGVALDALQKGRELSNWEIWKDRQRAGSLLVSILGTFFLVLKHQGVDLGLDPGDITDIGMGIAAAVGGVANWYLTVATSNRIGRDPKQFPQDGGQKGFALRFLLCVIVVFALFLLAFGARAAVPLQPAQSGLYYDPFFTGQGVDLKVIERSDAREVFAVFYLGRTGEHNRWGYIHGAANGSTAEGASFDLRESNVEFAQPGGDPVGAVIGSVTLFSTACHSVIANVTLDDSLQQMFLIPLIRDNDAQCYACADVQFSPIDPKCE